MPSVVTAVEDLVKKKGSCSPIRKELLRLMKDCWQMLPYRVEIQNPIELLESGISYSTVQETIVGEIYKYLFPFGGASIIGPEGIIHIIHLEYTQIYLYHLSSLAVFRFVEGSKVPTQ